MVALTNVVEMDEEDQQKSVEFENLLNEGKRALALSDYQLAADNLSEAAQLSVQIFGEFDKGVFESHFYYGKVLLELERFQKGNIITEAVGGQNDTNDEEDSEYEASEEGVSVTEPSEVSESISVGVQDGKTQLGTDSNEACCHKELGGDELPDGKGVEEKQTFEPVKDEASGNVEEGCTAEEGSSASFPDENEVKETFVGEKLAELLENGNETLDDDDEASPLQVAWEVLEIARTVCERNLTEEEWKEKKVEVLLVLAQCSLEGENYEQAIEDLNTCIETGKSIFAADDRRFAEANYQAGQACCLSGQFQKAAEYFSKAKEVLLQKCCSLEKKITSAGDDSVADKEELKELKALIPEIQLKIDDCEGSEEAERLKKIAMEKLAQSEAGQKSSSGESTSFDKPVDDITGLVRKKRQKRTNEAEDAEAPKRNKLTVEKDDED